MITINVDEFVGKNNIVSVNENEYYYEFNLENTNRLILHKYPLGDKHVIETDGNVILVEPSELTNTESVLNSLNKL
jgi:hypothetical protein